MESLITEALGGWENFNVIVGSSAGALIGLQFVLISLIASRPVQPMKNAAAAFGTPTVVHFSVVLFLSAIASAPWKSPLALKTLWGLVGLCGLTYTIHVIREMKTQNVYQPVLEDWIFHAVFPFCSYVLILVAMEIATRALDISFFSVGSAMLMLLFTGVHNSWDAVTYNVFKQEQDELTAQKN